MLTYSFTDIGSDSLYHHLYNCIKKDIVSGVLAPDTKLPSKRSFAKNLGVSNITVENAYAALQAEGYLYSIPKKGFYVSKLTDLIATDTPSSAPVLQETPSSPNYLADFVSNRMNPDQFPFSVWSKIIRETLSSRHEELMTASPWGGIAVLRHAICGHLKAFRGMDVSPDQIIVGAGTEYLYGLLIQLLGQDKIVAVENPGYHKISKIYESSHVTCIPVSIGEHGISVAELERSGAHIAHISPAHHFPTGIVTPIGTRYELLGWATKQSGRYIIEDDYDSEFRLNGNPIPTMQSIDVSERVIYMNTFTKTLSSTMRISYMVLPKHLLTAFAQNLSFYSCTVSNFEQYTLAYFIEEGYFEKHINRMRTYYRGVRDALLDTIRQSPLGKYCTISEEDAGLHFLLQVQTPLSDEKLTQKAHQAGIRISCLSQYYYDTKESVPEHVLVFNYSGVTRDSIPKAIHLLADCIEPLDR